MKMNSTTIIIALLLLILCAVVADIAITRTLPTGDATGPALPCAAIPTRFVVEHRECAQMLLESMNVTNARIQRPRHAQSAP